jgi:hypothetical protein
MQKRNIRLDAQETALSMIRLHGLRAQAVALERAVEMRHQGDIAGLDRWQQIHAAICELRRTAPSPHGEATPGLVRSGGFAP